MDLIGRIRRMHRRDKKSVRAIARVTGLSRNTVRRWLRAPGDLEPHYERSVGVRKLTDYEAILIAALKADRLRHKHSRRTARALFLQIRAQGYRGSYSRVTDFIRAWRNESSLGKQAFVPLSFEQGEAFQFDWSEEGVVVGGVFHKAQVAHMKLCASRGFFLVAYPEGKKASEQLKPPCITAWCG